MIWSDQSFFFFFSQKSNFSLQSCSSESSLFKRGNLRVGPHSYGSQKNSLSFVLKRFLFSCWSSVSYKTRDCPHTRQPLSHFIHFFFQLWQWALAYVMYMFTINFFYIYVYIYIKPANS